MAKKSALILASTALAGILACSFPTAFNSGDFEAENVRNYATDNPDWWDGYNFFGGAIVESTAFFDTFDGDVYIRNAFGNWTPQYESGYTKVDDYIDSSTDETYINTEIYTSYMGPIEVADPFYIYRYSRSFEVDYTYEDEEITEHYNAYKWRVYLDSPIIVPWAFLEQFILGLSLEVQGDIESFNGDMYIYNFTTHYFDRHDLALRSGDEVGGNLMNSISPSSLRTILDNPRYVYYEDTNTVYPVDLDYNGGWVFCKFDLSWETDGTEDTSLYYSNRYAPLEMFNVLENATAEILAQDTHDLWNRFYGDTVFLEPINPPDIIFGTVEGFLSTEFVPDFSFGDLLLIVLGVMVFGAFLKVFLGG